MTNNRFHIPFDPKYEEGMARFKKQYRIRFFKKLDGGQPGWSVPLEYKDHVREMLQDNKKDQATQCDMLLPPTPPVDPGKQRIYKNDIPDEVKSFFKTFLE